MITSIDILDQLKADKSLSTDYKVAKYLDKPLSTIYGWRKGREMEVETFIELGADLGIDEDEIYTSLLINRQSHPKLKEYIEKKLVKEKSEKS